MARDIALPDPPQPTGSEAHPPLRSAVREEVGHALCRSLVMNTTRSPQPLHADAPALIQDLRRLFDDRMLELHAVARTQVPVQENGTSPMVHVDFPAGALQATAIYHTVEDRFTQLIARAADEAHFERPSFTISLFL